MKLRLPIASALLLLLTASAARPAQADTQSDAAQSMAALHDDIGSYEGVLFGVGCSDQENAVIAAYKRLGDFLQGFHRVTPVRVEEMRTELRNLENHVDDAGESCDAQLNQQASAGSPSDLQAADELIQETKKVDSAQSDVDADIERMREMLGG